MCSAGYHLPCCGSHPRPAVQFLTTSWNGIGGHYQCSILAEQTLAGGGLQRPLRSRFQPRLALAGLGEGPLPAALAPGSR
jgi:hypothetical protein